MSTQAEAGVTTKVFEIYINATAEAVWDAITSPEWNGRYGYRATGTYDLRPGGKYTVAANEQMRSFGLPETIIDGEVIECSPPFKLVQTYRWLFNDSHKEEGFTKITWEVAPTEGGFIRLTVTHELGGAAQMSAAVSSQFSTRGGGGWNWILSDIKSLLETGKNLGA